MMNSNPNSSPPVGLQIRSWRQRRRRSQLDLALDAEISAKHLSFLETGRSRPSRDMVLRLAEKLGIPLRERNELLVAAGFAPVFPERGLDDPGLDVARRAIDLVLKGHEPFPALAVDRRWTLVAMNAAVPPMLVGVAPWLLEPPANVLRLGLHPEGLAPRVVNFGEWRAHVLQRLRAQIDVTADRDLIELDRELRSYAPPPRREPRPPQVDYANVVVPFRLEVGEVELAFFSTITVFGTPVDITLSELAIEAFFPADDATAAALRA